MKERGTLSWKTIVLMALTVLTVIVDAMLRLVASTRAALVEGIHLL